MDPAAGPRYRYPPALVAQVGWSLLCGRWRPFAPDATRLCQTLRPPARVEGREHIPLSGSLVAVFNHYHSPTLPAWWGPIAITAAVHARRPTDTNGCRWVMTNAWTYPDPLRQRLLTPLTRWAFGRLARLYGFFAMPPMPPRPQEVEPRARVVRQVLAAARQPQPPLIGLSPEGHDSPDASLLVPPPGVGRFLLHLAGSGLPLLPVGVFESEGQLIVRFGPPFNLRPPPGLTPQGRDGWASRQVMLAIGRELPPQLWGAYRDSLSTPPAQPPP